jgi:hypothetical protein
LAKVCGFLEHLGSYNSAFDGMQPTLRQVPPLFRSFRPATFMPIAPRAPRRISARAGADDET